MYNLKTVEKKEEMGRDNFRLKVDLSKFYDDVRRSSWIYVDGGSMLCICHLQRHIMKVFDIQRSFHLLLGSGEYLPPNEDSRILKEDETVLVVPGSGLQNEYSNPTKTLYDVQINTSCFVSQQKQRASDPIVSPKVKVNNSSDLEDDLQNSLAESAGENTVFLSMINESQMETASESKPEVNVPEESTASEISHLKNKRKRVRRKKSKNETLPEQVVDPKCSDDFEYKKPKIINSVTIPNGKHIRFGDVEKHEFHAYDSSTSSDSKKQDSKAGKNGMEDSYWDQPMAGSNLSSLLALRQSSTPITFGRKRTEEANLSYCQTNKVTREAKKIEVEERLVFKSPSTVDPKKQPLLEREARVGDVIAFKMLKMGSDYTPQVSGYIIAKLMHILADKLTHIFKILEGKSEIQAPQGKFDLETEENENDTEGELITLNWAQVIEPRLIYSE